MIKNIIIIFLTVLLIIFGTLYVQEKSNKEQQKEYSEKNMIVEKEENKKQVEIEELNVEEPVKVVFYNSNIKSEEDNNTLEEVFDKLENILNIYTTLNEEIIPRYNLLKFVQECKKIIKEQESREIIHFFIEQKHECRMLEDIYTTQCSRSSLDKRIIRKQRKNIVDCYKVLEMLTFGLEDTIMKLVLAQEKFSSKSYNLRETDLAYFEKIVKIIERLKSIIDREKRIMDMKKRIIDEI